jgi:hypothetical protein
MRVGSLAIPSGTEAHVIRFDLMRSILVPFLSASRAVRYLTRVKQREQLRNGNVVKFEGLWFIIQGCVTFALTTFMVLGVISFFFFTFRVYLTWNCRFLVVELTIHEMSIQVCSYIM